MKIIEHLKWGGHSTNYPGQGIVFYNGRASDLAAVHIFTVFGFGFCCYYPMPKGKIVIDKDSGFPTKRWRLGFFRFARNRPLPILNAPQLEIDSSSNGGFEEYLRGPDGKFHEYIRVADHEIILRRVLKLYQSLKRVQS